MSQFSGHETIKPRTHISTIITTLINKHDFPPYGLRMYVDKKPKWINRDATVYLWFHSKTHSNSEINNKFYKIVLRKRSENEVGYTIHRDTDYTAIKTRALEEYRPDLERIEARLRIRPQDHLEQVLDRDIWVERERVREREMMAEFIAPPRLPNAQLDLVPTPIPFVPEQPPNA